MVLSVLTAIINNHDVESVYIRCAKAFILDVEELTSGQNVRMYGVCPNIRVGRCADVGF